MLVLKLKAGDKVQIGENVTLVAQRVKDSTVRIAIDASDLNIEYDRSGRETLTEKTQDSPI